MGRIMGRQQGSKSHATALGTRLPRILGDDDQDGLDIARGLKQLYLPQGISVCLFRDPDALGYGATTAAYQATPDSYDVGRFSIEGSRSAMALLVHAALQVIGLGLALSADEIDYLVDSLLYADHLETLVDALQAVPEASGAYGLAFEVRTEIQSHDPWRYRELDFCLRYRQPFSRALLWHHNFMPIQCVLFRRELFDRNLLRRLAPLFSIRIVLDEHLGVALLQLLHAHGQLRLQGTAFYLLFNGILGDRRPDGGNVLTAPVLEALPAHDGPRVVFGEACRLHDSRLAALGVDGGDQGRVRVSGELDAAGAVAAVGGGSIDTANIVNWPRRPQTVPVSGALWLGDIRVGGAGASATRASREPVIVEYARSFFPVILAVLLLRSFIVEPFRIPSGSMMPTLLVGDFILVNKFAYGLRWPVLNSKFLPLGEPARGDVVVFRDDHEVDNDYAGALSQDDDEPAWFLARRAAAYRAYYEHMPLPPYIDRADDAADRERYQTVYSRRDGAVAAPTAGLHFDSAMMERLQRMGVARAHVTLHVGAGTFQPVREDDLDKHLMHAEWLEVSEEVCAPMAAARSRASRVVAVGTTTVRSLETAAASGQLQPYRGDSRLFIRPGYRFRVVEALLTNFHLPESTLLMLVSAFAGYAPVMAAYRHAVEARYRFFSYGDAMFLTRRDAGEAQG